MIRMPGKSYNGPLTPPSSHELAISDQLRQDVKELAWRIGQRNVYQYSGLVASVEFLKESLVKAGYEVQIQDFTAEGKTCSNIAVEINGDKKADEIVIVGAHYDSVFGTTGANDNASGVAATLALARLFADSKPLRTLRFVFFANEEPPFFQTERGIAPPCEGNLQFFLNDAITLWSSFLEERSLTNPMKFPVEG